MIAGLQDQTGRFNRAIEELSLILNTRGQVVSATLEDVELVAEMEDGALVRGECTIAEDPRRIQRMMLSRLRVRAYTKALEAIRQTNLILLGPGSLFTNIIPKLLGEGIAAEIERTRALKIYS